MLKFNLKLICLLMTTYSCIKHKTQACCPSATGDSLASDFWMQHWIFDKTP